MTPICITNKGTEIYPPEKGFMARTITYKVCSGNGKEFGVTWKTRKQIERLVKAEGVKSGGI